MKKKLILLILLFNINLLLGQWTNETQLPGGNNPPGINNICVADSIHVWVIGYYSNTDSPYVAQRTLTGWKSVSIDGIRNNNPICIAAKDSLKAWIGMSNGKIYYTSNGGINWILQVNTGGNGFINDIKFSKSNANYGYAFSDPPNGTGTPFKIYKTTNDGLNWIEYSPLFGGTYDGASRSGCVTDSMHFWFGLAHGLNDIPKVAFTSNGGINWSTRTLPGQSYFVQGVQFSSDNNFGLVTYIPNTNQPPIYKTTNSGLNWIFSYFIPTNLPSVQNFINIYNSTNWYYSTLNEIARSSDNGTNWNNMVISLESGEQVLYMDIVSEGDMIFGWAITNLRNIFYYREPFIPIGINSNNSLIPKDFNLHQNYPNPFNPLTKINYSLPKATRVHIRVYDLLGRLVKTLVNEFKEAGSYDVQFDGTGFASGVYFYRIEAGNFVVSKKMVLVK